MKLKFRKPSDYELTVIKLQMKKNIKAMKKDRLLNTIAGLLTCGWIIIVAWLATYRYFRWELEAFLPDLAGALGIWSLVMLIYNITEEIGISKINKAEYKVAHGVMVNREDFSIAVALMENLPEDGQEITSDMLKDQPVIWVNVGVNQIGLYQPNCPCMLVRYGDRDGLFDKFDCYPIVGSRQLFFNR